MELLRQRLKPLLESLVGSTLFALLALTAAIVTRQSSYRASVPLLFIVVAAVTAFLVGRTAAYLGLIGSAIIFSVTLFEPLGSWHVNAQDARANLAWMLMGGTAAAWIFARRDNPQTPDKKEQ